MRLIDAGMRDTKYIRADLLMNKIARDAFFSAAEKGKICVVIDKEPGEDVRPVVHAHWIDQKHGTYKCSSCGQFLDFRGVNAGRGDANYCPHCGAKMEVGENAD